MRSDPRPALNMFDEVCGRWARNKRRQAVVVRRPDGSLDRWTYADLEQVSSSLAAVLTRTFGLRAGDRVGGLLDRGVEPFVVALATWRAGCVYVPLFTGFGATALADRMRLADVRAVVVDTASRELLADAVNESGLDPRVVEVAQNREHPGAQWSDMLATAPMLIDSVRTGADDPAVLMFTSGTTGQPKACVVPHGGWLATVPYARYVLALEKGDLLSQTSDPGWSYGLITTGTTMLALGRPLLVQGGRFDADAWLTMMRDSPRPAAMTGAPTAFRRLCERLAASGNRWQLRSASCGGEVLDRATAEAWQQYTGSRLRDGYGLTEVGMVLADLGSGVESGLLPIPGFEVRLVHPDDPAQPVDEGRLLIRRPPHQLSIGYENAQNAWKARWVDNDWFATDDLFRRSDDGRYSFRGRVDDVIVTSGYNVAAVDIEAAIRLHSAVADVAVVGKPDRDRGQAICAVVVPRYPLRDSAEVLADIQNLVRRTVGRHAAPRELRITTALPRTESGKVRRAAALALACMEGNSDA